MFILRDILRPLQNEYSSTCLGKERSRWFNKFFTSAIKYGHIGDFVIYSIHGKD